LLPGWPTGCSSTDSQLLAGAVGTNAGAVVAAAGPSFICSVTYWQSTAVLEADGREQLSPPSSDRLWRCREQQW